MVAMPVSVAIRPLAELTEDAAKLTKGGPVLDRLFRYNSERDLAWEPLSPGRIGGKLLD